MNLLRWLALAGSFGVMVGGCGGGDPSNGPGSGPEADGTTVTIKMTGFTVPPNSEIWKCQSFANPFGGKQVDVRTWDFQMTPGSHHMTLFNIPGATNTAIVDCPDGVPGGTSYSFGSQTAKLTYTYPPAVGETIPGGTGFTINSHYINATAEPIQAEVVVKIVVAAPGVVTQHAGGYEGVLMSISVPPTEGQPVTVGSTCTLPQDMIVLAASGHMHHRGSHFIATANGKTLTETDETGSPPNTFSPPLQLKAGTEIKWSCIYKNETDQTLVYGQSALNNVMCNTVLAFYPVINVDSPTLGCFH